MRDFLPRQASVGAPNARHQNFPHTTLKVLRTGETRLHDVSPTCPRVYARALKTQRPLQCRVNRKSNLGNRGIGFVKDRAGRYNMGMKLSDRITFNPRQCGGRPCIRAMRIRVKDVLDLLAARVPEAEILADYPYLEAEDIQACIAYAAEQQDHPVLVVSR